MDKKILWISITLCGFIAGLIPQIWGAGVFSLWGVLFSGLGGLFGILIAYKINQ